MASRRTTSTIQSSSADGKSLKSVNGARKTNKNATGKKPLRTAAKSNGVLAQSQSLQAADERTSVSKSNPPNSDSASLPQRLAPKLASANVKVGTPPRCSMGPPAFGTLNGSIVPSRYMQAAEKSSLSKSNSLSNVSGSLPQRFLSPKPSHAKVRVGTPPRCSMGSPALGTAKVSHKNEPSLLGKTVLQSTFSDGHCFRPDFDMSVIGDKTVLEKTAGAERNPEDKKWIEMQALLLTYVTAKVAHNTEKLKAKAEARLLHAMDQEEALRSEVMAKKRQYLLMEKRRQANELLDLQISTLMPALEAAKPFTEAYTNLASAVDTTRHELPVKNFHIGGDGREFLSKAEAFLKESETLLRECTAGDHEGNRVALECLKDIKRASKDMSQQLCGVSSELLELSSLVSRHTVQVQQAVEEEQLGPARVQELFCPKR
ncbi:HAUS augmin-like complex subunit 8 [Phyllopteryx taeniolatus]|uniref:HAUS augmin-like complex subunit 8 n=1 Tax=Phyllopteryx taeniolatus TaxID=161469 RepID=UPI002AD38888|nr:HAUS augmin-like complex subunit 8 [Phyllopteryx taeniolatus]